MVLHKVYTNLFYFQGEPGVRGDEGNSGPPGFQVRSFARCNYRKCLRFRTKVRKLRKWIESVCPSVCSFLVMFATISEKLLIRSSWMFYTRMDEHVAPRRRGSWSESGYIFMKQILVSVFWFSVRRRDFRLASSRVCWHRYVHMVSAIRLHQILF